MPLSPKSPINTAVRGDRAETASTRRESPTFECYCGLGPACPLFRAMTPQQRTACSRDKRQTGQSYYKNGLT